MCAIFCSDALANVRTAISKPFEAQRVDDERVAPLTTILDKTLRRAHEKRCKFIFQAQPKYLVARADQFSARCTRSRKTKK